MFHFLWCPYFSCHFTPTLRLQSVDHSPAAGHLTCPLHSFPKATLTLGGLGRGGRGLKGGMGRGKEDGKRITGERGICWKNKSALREAPQESSLVLSQRAQKEGGKGPQGEKKFNPRLCHMKLHILKHIYHEKKLTFFLPKKKKKKKKKDSKKSSRPIFDHSPPLPSNYSQLLGGQISQRIFSKTGRYLP